MNKSFHFDVSDCSSGHLDDLFGSEYEGEIQISEAADDNSLKRANVRNYAFVRGVIQMKRIIEMNAKLRLHFVVIFSLVREESKAV